MTTMARLVARAFGWVFLLVIAIHGEEAAHNAVRAVSAGDWARVGEQSAIAIVVAALVIGCVVFAIRAARGSA